MNDYNENKNEQSGYNTQGGNTGGQNPNDNTESNTTYHYSYKNANNSRQNSDNSGYNQQNNTYYNQQNNQNNSQNGYYTPPYQNTGDTQNNQSVKYDKNGNPIQKKKKNKTIIILVSVLLVCVVVAVIGLFAGGVIQDNAKEDTNKNNTSSQVETEEQNEVEKTDKNGNYTVAGIAENFIDSCVGITVYTQGNNLSNFYGYGSNSSSNSGDSFKSGEGSGIIMLEDNGRTYILTCAHVISEGSTFEVTLNDGTKYDAAIVGFDSQTDIGVLSIKATGLKVAKFANSDSTVLGEQVVAIGCPGGLEFMNSVTSGYVSALARPISSKIGYNTECIQIDAAINPGNSGGALFNMSGQIIGVNSSKIASTEYEGMGFAVPSNTALATANSLIKSGYVEGRAKIGITYKNIKAYSNSDAILSSLGKLGYEKAEGTMVINEVESTSDLANKNVKEYDMIVAVDGKTLTSTDVLTSVLASSKPGDTIKLTIARIENNQIDTFDVDCKLIESKGN